jgi:hypothetical protein
MASIEVIVPVADYQDFTEPKAIVVPKRPDTISGKKIMCVPNWKAISAPFMDVFARRLNQDTDVKSAVMFNPDWQFTHPERVGKIGPEIDRLAKECDLMCSGVAD